jgi:hypothetical protein
MPALHIGCLLDRLPGARLTERINFFELLPRPPIPWLTPRGPMRPGKELDEGVEWILRAADSIAANVIVVPTAAELTPGERDRTLTAAFFERLRPSGKTLVFAPGGLWEPEQGVPFVEQIGAVYGFDPLEHDAPRGAVVYARIKPMGVRARLSEGHLMRAAERLLDADCEHIYVSVASEHGPRDAGRMLAALTEAGELKQSESEEDDDDLDEEEESDEEESDEEASDEEESDEEDD